MAAPGGYANKADRADRAEKVRRLYQEGVPVRSIATRLGMSVSRINDTTTALGLRDRKYERRKK